MNAAFLPSFARRRWRALLAAVPATWALIGCPAFAAPEATFFARKVQPFLEQHCFDCHDDSTQKGGVRLDDLAGDLAKRETSERWIDVLDQIESGAMPPKKKARPPAGEAKAVTGWLRTGLRDAALAQKKANGATVMRRLNRAEYENTVRDLFGIEAELQDLLPEDARAGGFDNIGAALSTSSILMERYLEAADAALDAAIANEPKPETKSGTYSYVGTKLPGYLLGKTIFELPDAVVFKKEGMILSGVRTHAGGVFRIRVHAAGYESQGRPVLFAVYGGRFYREPTRLLGYFQAPADEPGVIEFTAPLPSQASIKITPYPFAEGEASADGPSPGLAVHSVDVEGPLLDAWPPAPHRRIFGDAELLPLSKAKPAVLEHMKPYDAGRIFTPISAQPEADTERIVRAFLPRAFRRPVEDPEAGIYVALALARLKDGGTFEEAVRVGLKAALSSPSFLFLHETPGRLDDFALASRLSYFLWSSMPDDELLALARKGQLNQPGTLHAQVERMLSSAKAKQFTERFTDQWLELRNIDFNLPDSKLYPEFDEWLGISMLGETRRFFDEVLAHDSSVANFIASDFSMLNGRLAHHYGIPGVSGTELRKVQLPAESHRGGVLTQASVLKVSANGTTTSPVIRGNYVLRNILGKPVPPPPAATPAIEPDIRGAQTIREQLVKHRQSDACAACHDKMDPPGFALESFDPIGGWRDQYRALGPGRERIMVKGGKAQYHFVATVDSSGVLPGGRAFANLDEFKKLLLADRKQIARCVTEKLLTYATGHPLNFADRESVQQVIERTRAGDFGLRSVIHAVVLSETFLTK
ncbi:MAG: hypothetical protein QOE70_5323 [Chthoniobacter sp.]|jgi:hypothetical protein|nr:hypothetical protein [Chthoniobacter sp.]